MTNDRKTERGGGTNSRPLNDTIAQTGGGVPDDAVGPGELGPAEEAALVNDAEAKAMAEKLEREARQWREADEARAADAGNADRD